MDFPNRNVFHSKETCGNPLIGLLSVPHKTCQISVLLLLPHATKFSETIYCVISKTKESVIVFMNTELKVVIYVNYTACVGQGTLVSWIVLNKTVNKTLAVQIYLVDEYFKIWCKVHNISFIYSPLYHPKPAWLAFFCKTKKETFLKSTCYSVHVFLFQKYHKSCPFDLCVFWSHMIAFCWWSSPIMSFKILWNLCLKVTLTLHF